MTATRFFWRRSIGLVATVVALVVAMFANPQFSYAEQQYMLSAASVQIQTTQVGTAFADPMMVLVCEAYSNPCKAVRNIGVTFAAPSSGASGTFATTGSSTVTVISNASGIATAPAFTANTSLGSYSVRVAAAEPTPSDAVPNFFFFTNSANPADKATLISTGDGSNQTVEVNTIFPTRLSVAVVNGRNQLLQGVKVTFSAPSNGAGGTFADSGTATTTAVTGPTGLATAAAFKANGVDGAYIVTATVDGSQTSSGSAISNAFALKNSLTNANGVPEIISMAAGSGQQGGLFAPFPTNLQVAIFDGSQRYVPNVTVIFTAPSSGASGTFAGGLTTYSTTTGITGLASAPTFTSNGIIGAYAIGVSASKNGVTVNGSIGLSNARVKTTTAIIPNPATSSVYGQPIAISAKVQQVAGSYMPSGTISFQRNGADIAGCVRLAPSNGVATCTLNGDAESTWLASGNYSFSASYDGDANSQPSTSIVTNTVSKANVTLALTTSKPQAAVVYGDSVTFTANVGVVAPGRGAPAGTVSFISSDGTVLNGGNPVPLAANGSAQVSTNGLKLGTAKISATYSGSTNFQGAAKDITQQVATLPTITTNPASQTIVTGNPASFSAAGTSELAPSVQWQVSADQGRSFSAIPGATATTYSFYPRPSDNQKQYRAVFTNAAGATASTVATLTVPQLWFANNDSARFELGVIHGFSISAGGARTPTVRLTSGTLPQGLSLDMSNGGVRGVIGTPAAGTAGSYALVFTASDGVNPDITQNFTLTVRDAPKITSSSVLTLTAGVTSRFTFMANSDPAPRFRMVENTYPGFIFAPSGLLVATPQEGFSFTMTVIATNGTQLDATQTVTVIVLKVDQTPLVLSVTPQSGKPGDRLPITVTGGSGNGWMTFDAGASTACQVDAGSRMVMITKGVGTCQVTATKRGDYMYNDATSAPVSITVSRFDQYPLVVSAPVSTAMPGMMVPLNVTGGGGYGAVSFDVGSSTACQIRNTNMLMITNSVGTCQVTATKAGDDAYNSATSAPISIEVKAP